MSDDSLDKRMISAGMIPLSKMLKGSPLDAFHTHAGVNNLAKFEEWLNMRHEETMRMFARFELDKRQDDELYEWVAAHMAVFKEVVLNFRAAKEFTD